MTRLPSRRPSRPDPDPPPERSRDRRIDAGAVGEALAAAALKAAGYRIAARNLRTRHGEIDLLVRRGRIWIAVEVKTRSTHPAPERTVTAAQLDRLAAALAALAPSLRPRPRALRVDLIAVRPWPDRPELLHFAGLRAVAQGDDGGGGWARALGPDRDRPKFPKRSAPRRLSPQLPTRMSSLVEQFMPRRKALLLLSENLVFTLVLLVGTSAPPLSSQSFLLVEPSKDLLLGFLTCFTIAILCQASLSYNDLYDWRTAQNRAELGHRLLRSAGYALVMFAALVVVAPKQLFHFPGLRDPSGETWKLILLLAIAFGLIYALRHAFHWFFYRWRFGERIVIIGGGAEARSLGRLIQQNPLAGYELLGFVPAPDEPVLPCENGDAPSIGSLDQLRALCQHEGISRVVVALHERRGRLPVGTLLECRTDGVTVEEREAMFERLTGKLAVESMRPSYLIYGRGFIKDPLTMALKRVTDIVFAGLGLVLALPLGLLAALAIKLTSRGPVFFTQERTGQDGAPFRLIKFRTMQVDAEKHSGPVWAEKNDKRITPIGRFLRLSRIDEIPQLVNILSGHMSFVGPRPERPHFVEQLTREIPFYPLRHTVKPGLTGWAQVQHTYGASVDDAREKLRYDLYYIKNMALLLDLTIIWKTVAVILHGKGAR